MNPAILTRLRNECRALIADNPELAEDAQLRADMIEGETILADVLNRLERADAEADGDIVKLEAMMEQLEARAEAARRRKFNARTAISRVLDAAGIEKFKADGGTIYLGHGRPKVIELNKDECPEAFRKQSWSPDKTAIGDALKAGQPVAGFALSNCPSVLNIRR